MAGKYDTLGGYFLKSIILISNILFHASCIFARKKVATFANSDTYGSSGISQFQSSAISLGVQIISSSLFPQGQTDFAGPIAEAKQSGARIFVFFMAAKDMGNLLVQGHAAGLFGEGTQVIASDAAVVDFWAGIPKGQVAQMMKGLIAFTPSAGYSTPKGSKFLDSFIHQANTVRDPLTGRCNDMTDDDGNYLFKGSISPNPTGTSCSGLNFTKFHLDGTNIDNFVSYTYDAVYALARAMHFVLYDQNKPFLTGKDLYSALINNVSFSGATGTVDFSNATTTDSTRFGEGDRRTGVTYAILNFSPEVYGRDPSGISGFVTVGGWTIEEGNIFTAPITYNTFDNSVPSDLPPAIKLTMLPFQATILMCFGSILLLIATIFGLTLFYARATKLVKSIHYRMQCIMIFGAICGAVRVFFGTTKVTDVNCSASMWLYHVAFWMIFAPMMLKTWRVHRIVNNRTLELVKVTENSILGIFGAILLFIVAYLTVLQTTSVTTPKKVTVYSQIGIQLYLDDQCGREGDGASS
jgi:Receptor family ligand binding region/7 transmembrane sweet-taste receptor of 3 GCPR